jgi:Na+/glutamate symporter
VHEHDLEYDDSRYYRGHCGHRPVAVPDSRHQGLEIMEVFIMRKLKFIVPAVVAALTGIAAILVNTNRKKIYITNKGVHDYGKVKNRKGK